ncbi:malate:quinone oxidoreductase, partial [Staphylococcus epidermidis]|uniref:malate:quinone oxidoreductase n=1 Tax=Staphylococcus epidermidis TaxID=1282 RepID=UPI0021B33C1B
MHRHHPKLYAKPELPPPPISLPHLHTPFLNPQKSLLFPPFPPFSPKFFKNPSYLHLLKSLKPNNIITILTPHLKQFNFTNYLLSQLILSNQQP